MIYPYIFYNINYKLNDKNMIYCEKCGAEIEEDAKFCSKCGTPIGGYRREEWKGSRYECFGWERGGPQWGIFATGVFVIGIAILFYLDSLKILTFWPGILLLLGLMIIIGVLISYTRGGRRVERPTSSK